MFVTLLWLWSVLKLLLILTPLHLRDEHITSDFAYAGVIHEQLTIAEQAAEVHSDVPEPDSILRGGGGGREEGDYLLLFLLSRQEG